MKTSNDRQRGRPKMRMPSCSSRFTERPPSQELMCPTASVPFRFSALHLPTPNDATRLFRRAVSQTTL